MNLYCYTAEALSNILVRNWNAANGYITGFVKARSMTEAIRNTMNDIVDTIHASNEWSSDELSVSWSDNYGSITILEMQTGKIINHIQRITVHEC